MRKFFLFAAAIIAAMTVNAQEDKSWNFTELFPDAAAVSGMTFTKGDGATPDVLVPGELCVYGNAKDKAWALDPGQSAKYFVDFLTEEESIPQEQSDGTIKYKQTRLKSGGTGSIKDGKIKGAIAFCVAGDSYIQIAALSSSSSAVRKMNIVNLDGTVLESFLVAGNIGSKDKDGNIVTPAFEFEYEGPATTLFIVSAEAVEGDGSYVAGGINYYKVAATNVAPWSAPQGIEDIFTGGKAVKMFENGQLIIIKNGVKFNALGTRL